MQGQPLVLSWDVYKTSQDSLSHRKEARKGKKNVTLCHERKEYLDFGKQQT